MNINKRLSTYREDKRRQAMIELFATRPQIRAQREQERLLSLSADELAEELSKAHSTEVHESLDDYVGRLILVSNFYGDKERADSIASSLVDIYPAEIGIGFSVHLTNERIQGGVGDVIGDFESNVAALRSSLTENGFKNAELAASTTLVSAKALNAKSLADTAADLQLGLSEEDKKGHIHIAVVSALETIELGLPYDGHGGAYMYSGLDDDGKTNWVELDSLHITSPFVRMAQLAIQLEDAREAVIARDGSSPAWLDHVINDTNEEIIGALEVGVDPLSDALHSIRELPESTDHPK